MKKNKEVLHANETTPLKWPEGWPRTQIKDREGRASWKRTFREYRDEVALELQRMGATHVSITYNDGDRSRLDPGVAVWFSMEPQANFDWQAGLKLDNPAPSLAEIDSAYRTLAQKHHPDAVANGSGGDVEIFHKLMDYRKAARAWVLGERDQKNDNAIPCDKFTEIRLNLAAVANALKHFRGLERVGIPAILERVMTTAFKPSLPAAREVPVGAAS